MSKDLTHVFGFVTLRNNFDILAQKCCKEKLFEKIRKNSHAQVSHSFKKRN